MGLDIFWEMWRDDFPDVCDISRILHLNQYQWKLGSERADESCKVVALTPLPQCVHTPGWAKPVQLSWVKNHLGRANAEIIENVESGKSQLRSSNLFSKVFVALTNTVAVLTTSFIAIMVVDMVSEDSTYQNIGFMRVETSQCFRPKTLWAQKALGKSQSLAKTLAGSFICSLRSQYSSL